MSQQQRIPIYLTEPHKCSYLSDELAQTAFIDPAIPVTTALYSSLNKQGFRRSGDYFYRPQCQNCTACKSLRIPVSEFQATRSQRRCIKKNEHLQTVVRKHADIKEYYDLYCRYIEERHNDGDMYPPNAVQYENFLGKHSPFIRYIEFYQNEQLVMVSVADELADAISAIYTFFDPDLDSQSLGSYSILWQIQYAMLRKIPFVYLGFWIEQCEKMNYKSRYKSHQILENESWQGQNSE